MKRTFFTAVLMTAAALSWAEGIDKGLKLEADNRLSEARLFYEEHLKSSPSDSRVQIRLVHVLISMGELSAAESGIGKALSAPGAGEGAELGNEIGRLRFRQGRLKESAESFRIASERDPSFAEPAYNLGVVLQRLQKTEEAEAAYRKALKVDPKFVKAMVALGLLSAEGGDREKAIEILKEAEQISGSDFEVLSGLGMVLGDMDRKEESVEYYRRAAAREKDSAEARNNYGRALLRIGRTSDAQQELAAAVRLNPDLPEAHLNLGALLESQGRTEEARKELELSLNMAPRMTEAAFRLGNMSLFMAEGARKAGDVEGEKRQILAACDYFRKAAEADESFADAIYNLSLALIKAGKYAEASRWAAKLVKAQPRNPAYQFLLGTVELQAGDATKAEKAYRAALKLDPKCLDCNLRLGSLLFQTGKFDSAGEYLSAALKIDGKSGEALYLLGLVHFRQGELRKAEKEMMAALELKPDNLEIINSLANVSIRLKNMKNAAAYVGRAVDADPAYLPIFRTAEMLYSQTAEVEISGSPKTNEILMNFVIGIKSLSRNNATAEGSFKKMLAVEPRCSVAHLKLGMLYILDRRFKQGIDHLEQAETISPGDSEVRYALGTGYFNLAEEDPRGAKSPHFLKALKAYQGAVKAAPGNPDAHWGAASTLYRMGRYKEARVELENCLRLNPFFGEAYNTLGSVLANEAQEEREPQKKAELLNEARKAYGQALRANPNSETAHYNLGVILHEQKNYKEAIGEYEAAIRLNPRFPVAWYRLGRLYAERDNWFDKGRAEKTYLKLLEIDGGNCEYLFDFGVFYFNSGQFEKAKEAWEKTLNKCPGHKPTLQAFEMLVERGY